MMEDRMHVKLDQKEVQMDARKSRNQVRHKSTHNNSTRSSIGIQLAQAQNMPFDKRFQLQDLIR